MIDAEPFSTFLFLAEERALEVDRVRFDEFAAVRDQLLSADLVACLWFE